MIIREKNAFLHLKCNFLNRHKVPESEVGMFYVKENVSDTMAVSVEINDENVFCKCPECGGETNVDLEALSHTDEGLDLFGSAVLCEECSKKLYRRNHRE